MALRWDLFCRVIDNYGDIGVCWRLAADLGARGEAVRLWVDDTAPLRWMAPGGAPGVQVVPWGDPASDVEPGDVVIEAFGCDPPAGFVERMAARAKPPVWINLEYLSAEDYVARSHGLASPQASGPGRGLVKWFFYPGFTAGTGGLLREPGLQARRAAFDRSAWLARQGIIVREGERVVTLFCYENPALPALVDELAREPTLLLLTPGHAQRQMHRMPALAGLRTVALPWLAQHDYDRLLWSADLNFVRGEDSLVRALWAGTPFVWQIYPQHDGAHAAKLDAFLATFCAGIDGPFANSLRQLWHRWNGLGDGETLALPPAAHWAQAAARWRNALLAQPDLTTQLLGFVAQKS